MKYVQIRGYNLKKGLYQNVVLIYDENMQLQEFHFNYSYGIDENVINKYPDLREKMFSFGVEKKAFNEIIFEKGYFPLMYKTHTPEAFKKEFFM